MAQSISDNKSDIGIWTPFQMGLSRFPFYDIWWYVKFISSTNIEFKKLKDKYKEITITYCNP